MSEILSFSAALRERSSGSHSRSEGAGFMSDLLKGEGSREDYIALVAQHYFIYDALEAAGGARSGVDLTSLNLARPVVDGEQILVGVAPVAGVAGTLDSPVPGGAVLVNLNTADQVALESLPDVGPVTAQSILAWRSEHGAFTAVDQLLDVDGIGEVTLAKLTPYVTL